MRMMDDDTGFTGPVNIGNPGEFTIKELAELIIELTGSKSKIIYLPLPQDDPLQRKPDIALAKERLDWEPKVCHKCTLLRIAKDPVMHTCRAAGVRIKAGARKCSNCLSRWPAFMVRG